MEKKEKNVKPKVSNFLLTINTNQQYKPEDEHLSDDIEVFENSIVNILENIQDYVNLPDGVIARVLNCPSGSYFSNCIS